MSEKGARVCSLSDKLSGKMPFLRQDEKDMCNKMFPFRYRPSKEWSYYLRKGSEGSLFQELSHSLPQEKPKRFESILPFDDSPQYEMLYPPHEKPDMHNAFSYGSATGTPLFDTLTPATQHMGTASEY